MCEILPPYSITSRRTRQKEVEKIIKTLDYDIFRIEVSKNERLVDLIHIEKFEIHSDPSLKDYLFIPNEIFGDISK